MQWAVSQEAATGWATVAIDFIVLAATTMSFGQVMIAVFGVIGVSLALSESPRDRHMAPIVGLMGQPFWIYETFTGRNYGMFIVTLMYTYIWSRALWRGWRRSIKEKQCSN